jgi:hypothetical protein
MRQASCVASASRVHGPDTSPRARTIPSPQDLLDALEGALAGLRAAKLAAIDAFFRTAETLESAFTDACQRIGEPDRGSGRGCETCNLRLHARALASPPRPHTHPPTHPSLAADDEIRAVGAAAVGGGALAVGLAPRLSSGRDSGAGLSGAAGYYEDEVLLLLADRECLQGVLAAAHTARVGCMRGAEAAMARVEAERAATAMAEPRTADHRRDRARVAEARQLVAHAAERAAAVAG